MPTPLKGFMTKKGVGVGGKGAEMGCECPTRPKCSLQGLPPFFFFFFAAGGGAGAARRQRLGGKWSVSQRSRPAIAYRHASRCSTLPRAWTSSEFFAISARARSVSWCWLVLGAVSSWCRCEAAWRRLMTRRLQGQVLLEVENSTLVHQLCFALPGLAVVAAQLGLRHLRRPRGARQLLARGRQRRLRSLRSYAICGDALWRLRHILPHPCGAPPVETTPWRGDMLLTATPKRPIFSPALRLCYNHPPRSFLSNNPSHPAAHDSHHGKPASAFGRSLSPSSTRVAGHSSHPPAGGSPAPEFGGGALSPFVGGGPLTAGSHAGAGGPGMFDTLAKAMPFLQSDICSFACAPPPVARARAGGPARASHTHPPPLPRARRERQGTGV